MKDRPDALEEFEQKRREQASPPDGWAWALAAFGEISGTRQIGGMGGLGPIDPRAVAWWADEHDLGSDDYEALKYLIRRLDGVYLDHQRAQADDARKSRPKN